MRRTRVLTPSTGLRSVTTYVHMTVLQIQDAPGEAKIATRADRRRFGRSDDSRMAHMNQLRDRIERDAYAVDPQKVADAIVRRLLWQPRDADQCE